MAWIIAGIVFGVLVLTICILSIIAYKIVFYSPLKGQNSEYNNLKNVDYQAISGKVSNFLNQILSVPATDLYAFSYDGLKLHAYFYKSEGSKEFVILFHGYRRTARRSFCGLAMDLLKQNKNVILVDQRAHGLSEGHQTTFGKKEQYDVVTWVNFVKNYFGKDSVITVGGVSLGASSVLFAADKIDENVKIVSDSPFINMKQTFIKVIHGYKMPVWFFYPIAVLTAAVFCHMSLKCDAAITVNKSKNKILLIHCGLDKIVPNSVSEKLHFDNRDHVQYANFEGVEHGFTYLRQTEKYRKVFFDFLNQK